MTARTFAFTKATPYYSRHRSKLGRTKTMGKYTTKQIKNALDKLDEGWALDRQALLFDSALEPIYRIEDEDGNGYTQIHLMYFPVYECKGSHLYSYNVATGEYQIEANVSHYKRSGEVWCSFGLGQSFILGEPVKRRVFAELGKMTHKLTPDKIELLIKMADMNDSDVCNSACTIDARKLVS